MPFPDFTPTIPVLVRTRTERFGARPMILLGERRITYAEADERSARLARGLLASGLGKGSRVGLWLPNGPDWVVAFLAAARIGAIVVPVNTFYKPRELGWVMRHADVQLLLTLPRFLNADYLGRLEAAAPSLARQKAGALHVRELPYLRDVIVFGHPDRAWARPVSSLESAADANPAIDADFLREVESCVFPADPLIVIYSSGSTADPKGAVHTHGTLIRHSFNLNSFRDLRAEDRIFSPLPFFWVGGLVYTLMSAMHVGAFMLCEEVFEPGETLSLLERERATVVAGWPHYSRAMLEHPTFRSRDRRSGPATSTDPARGHAAQGPRAALELARHDRDLRPAHDRPHGRRSARVAAQLVRPPGPRRRAQDRRPADGAPAAPRRGRRGLCEGLQPDAGALQGGA
jgi:acyl-CoA synthetase (AMP-forming)/AMP-acid ligase II